MKRNGMKWNEKNEARCNENKKNRMKLIYLWYIFPELCRHIVRVDSFSRFPDRNLRADVEWK